MSINDETHQSERPHPPFLANSRFGFFHFLRERGGIRRIFRELTMLRDTLVAIKQSPTKLDESPLAKPCERRNALNQYTNPPKRGRREIS
jgi:hypothetical protein